MTDNPTPQNHLMISDEMVDRAARAMCAEAGDVFEVGKSFHLAAARAALEAAFPSPHSPLQAAGRWLPISLADRSISNVQDFPVVGITLRNSDRYWVRDEDGRVYEASWTQANGDREYWWDWEAESPVDPVEFMPHPLDPRFQETSE